MFTIDHLRQIGHADSEFAIAISIGHTLIPETVMTSFPVRIKTLITQEQYEMDEKLLQNADIKSGSAFQKNPPLGFTRCSLHAKVVMTSFPVCRKR